MRRPACVVVVPARDEEARIAGCLAALAGQTIGIDAFTVVVVLDACRDETGRRARRAAATLGLHLAAIEGPGAGVGWARRAGMDLACVLLDDGAGLIAGTDADTRPDPDWLERQCRHVRAGARAIAGLIELDEGEAAALPAEVLERRRQAAGVRLAEVRRRDAAAAHHHCAGASLALTAATYRRIGGIEPWAALEDAALEHRLADHGVPLLRAGDVRVRTSARRRGRTPLGLAVDLDAATRACELTTT